MKNNQLFLNTNSFSTIFISASYLVYQERLGLERNFRVQFSLLNSCLSASKFLGYWLFINTYKLHSNALFCMTMFCIP